MTLNEAIKHIEEVAEKKENLTKIYKALNEDRLNEDRLSFAEEEKCIKEHRQLADWLKELKQLREQEPCADCISRQAVLDLCDVRNKYRIPYEYDDGDNHIKGYDEGRIINVTKLKKLQPVTPQPKTGHWIFDEVLDKHYYCSECKSMGVDYWDYCPNCGAKMIEPQESEDK